MTPLEKAKAAEGRVNFEPEDDEWMPEDPVREIIDVNAEQIRERLEKEKNKRVRQWLGRARSINGEIDALLKAKRETFDQLTRITQNYHSDGAQSTKDPHKFDRLVELEAVIDKKIDELIEAKKEITEAINRLPDGRQRTVLLNYYIRCKTQEEIAVEMHYSYRNAKRWLRAGISEIEKLSLFGP